MSRTDRNENNSDSSDNRLRQLGYKPTLERSLKFLDNFGIAFCYMSPVVGVYSLFGYGLSTGGPAFFWTLPIVALGQILVALIFAEVASSYPLSGSLYHWAKMLRGPRYGWLAGWIYGCALLTSIAAIDYAGAPYVAQTLGIDPKPNSIYLITFMMLIAHTAFNVFGVRVAAKITDLGVYVEVAATLVLALVLFANGTTQPVSVLFDTAGVQGNGPYLPCFLAAMLAPIWVLFGFESAGSVAEEVVDATNKVPRAIIYSLVGAVFVTALIYLALILSAPSMSAAMKDPAKTIAIIFEARIGRTMMLIFMALVSFAFFSCSTAIQAVSARLVFAYARDGMIPFSHLLSRVSGKHKAPIPALILTGIVGIVTVVLTQINIGEVNANALLMSYSTLGIYLSFQMVVLAYLYAKLKGWKPVGGFTLGKWGNVSASIALCYGVLSIIDLAWPRPLDKIAGWFPLLSVVIIVLSGLAFRCISSTDDSAKIEQAIERVPEMEGE